MKYTKTVWQNGQPPAISADNLNKIEEGIFRAGLGESCYTITQKAKVKNTIVVPFYEYPKDGDGNWTTNFLTLLSTIREYNKFIDFVVVPAVYNEGLSDVDPTLRYAFKCLKGAGALVAAYVDTNYGNRDFEEIKNSIAGYMDKYQYIEGFFYDRYHNDYDNTKDFYRQLADYSREFEPKILIGNVGTTQDYRFFLENLCDVFMIYETRGYPSASVYGTIDDGENVGNFDIPYDMKGAIPYGVSLDFDKIDTLMENMRYIYVTDNGQEGDDNPWDAIATYFNKFCKYVALRDTRIIKDNSDGNRYEIVCNNGTLSTQAL